MIEKKIDKNKKQKSWIKLISIICSCICILAIVVLGTLRVFHNLKQKQILEQEQAEIEENVEELKKEKEYKGIKITNISITQEQETTILKATMQNNTKKSFESRKVTINLLNKKGESVSKYRYYIDEIKAGESLEIELNGENITEACDFG